MDQSDYIKTQNHETCSALYDETIDSLTAYKTDNEMHHAGVTIEIKLQIQVNAYDKNHELHQLLDEKYNSTKMPYDINHLDPKDLRTTNHLSMYQFLAFMVTTISSQF